MAWSVSIVDTVTGKNRQRIHILPSTFTWERVMNAGGGGQTTFELSDREAYFGLVNFASTAPLAKTLVLSWEDHAVYAGIIWSRSYNRATKRLTLTHRDIWSLLPFWPLATTNGRDVNRGDISLPSSGGTLSLGTLAKYVVLAAQNAMPEKHRMPIDFPPDYAGPHRLPLKGYSLPTVQGELTKLMERQGGPDVEFQPYWDELGQLRYRMRAGNLTSGSWEWNTLAEDSGLYGAGYEDDASKVANRVFSIGEGSEEDMKIRTASAGAAPYPMVARELSHKDENDTGVLDARADEYLRVYANPTQQRPFTIPADGTPDVVALRLGGTARYWVDDDEFLPTGWYFDRVIQFSGDLSNNVALGLQEVTA